MNIFKKIKENIFLFLVLAAYLVLFAIRPELGAQSIKNSGYYIKEMIMIMPVIFVLTALFDLWVPKEKIMKYLGRESRSKGVILSLALGSISAGPIYAAFPMCVMLHKKGASIRNLIIILSSWAVIKIPMLLTEMKFLGLQFMLVRWVLTIFAIILFSWIAGKIVKSEDLPHQKQPARGLSLNKAACMGCTLCVKIYPALFSMHGKKAMIQNHELEIDRIRLEKAITACPVHAIEYEA